MDTARILLDILVVLVAAKLAAEVAERVGVPPVVGEIIAGVLVGPSVLGLVAGDDEVLRTLGEIGVILLLLDVGLEMDLGELGKVGRASMSVATVGVAAPLLLGLGAMAVTGQEFNTALFVGAALTATSVGITARVFGDLRALATSEARIVLGAAVADDVMGLIVLTVVVRLVTQGSVSVISVLGILLVAIGFLVIGGLLGLRVAPPLFAAVERRSRSTGTLVALALAFTLAFAELADAAKLAPIVGAFLAGIALSRSAQRDRIRRELTPVGHLFIPVFFLQIGIDTDIAAFARPAVLRDAALLLAVAVVGKLVAAIGAWGTTADRWLVGLGMLPRGEVGLIFATIGLQTGVLGQDLYAALLLVVLVTTLVTPQLLKVRYGALRAHRVPADAPAAAEEPPGGWLRVVDGEIRLAALPPEAEALTVALQAALEVAVARPSEELLDYLGHSMGAASWDPGARAAVQRVIDHGTARSWRFLETVGALDVALPEVAATIRLRQADPFLLDAVGTHRWGTLERVRSRHDETRLELGRVEHPDRLLLAALLVEGLEGRAEPAADAAAIALRTGEPPDAAEHVAALVRDDGMLRRAAATPRAFDEDHVVQLAAHLGSAEQARAAYLLAVARDDDLDDDDRHRLSTLHELLQRVLADPALAGEGTLDLVQQRRDRAEATCADAAGARRVRDAPRSLVARIPPAELARLSAVLADPPLGGDVRVSVTAAGPGTWTLDVAAHDRPGLMAAVTAVLDHHGLAVRRAVVATWPDRTAIESYVVAGEHEPDPVTLAAAVTAELDEPVEVAPVAGAEVDFDDLVSPWHTVATFTAPDGAGLLRAIAGVLAAASISIEAAEVGARDGVAVDRFDVTGPDGPRLDVGEQERVRTYLAQGVSARRRRFGRGWAVTVGHRTPSRTS